MHTLLLYTGRAIIDLIFTFSFDSLIPNIFFKHKVFVKGSWTFLSGRTKRLNTIRCTIFFSAMRALTRIVRVVLVGGVDVRLWDRIWLQARKRSAFEIKSAALAYQPNCLSYDIISIESTL